MAFQPLLGSIYLFAGNFAPSGYAMCNGQILAITSNTALFSILGTTYGGNGTSNFALPDLRSRVPIGMGQGLGLSNYVEGQVGGNENVSILTSNMPMHTHSLNILNGPATIASPAAGNVLAQPVVTHPIAEAPGQLIYGAGTPGLALGAGSVGNNGSGLPISVVQPFLALNYIIALQGVYPARN